MFAKLCAKRNKKGFTLAELLVVVAIIGVLVAIAIPVFTSSLEKANQAVEDANYRSAKAMAAVQVLNDLEGSNTGTFYYSYSVDDNGNITLTKQTSGTDGATNNTEGVVVITADDLT